MTRYDDDLTGVLNPDFLAIGLGGTNMMAMLWSIAMGKRAVGVEMRGNPFLGVHWNIRADFYHQLGLIDQMMLERYGEERIPKRLGERLKLADLFFGTETVAGDIVADNVVDGYDNERHIAGTIHHIEFIDDRWRDGIPNRNVTLLQPPAPPTVPDPAAIRTDMKAVLDGPSVFQGSASSVLIMLRRYLERIEELDMEAGVPPRCRLFQMHRVIPVEGDGFLRQEDGRLAVRIEALQELDYNGRFVRVRAPGTQPIDVGVPELFMIAEGFRSSDADRLGFEQKDVVVDHGDGRGPLVAQADFLAGLIEVLVGGRLRRRIATEFDPEGREYWVRQIAVGHENDPEVGWILVQVPDYKTFNPIDEGLVPAGTDPKSPEYFAAYDRLVHEYYMEQISEILEMPARDLKQMQMVYGPKMFSLVERMGDSAQVAQNGVVAGDSFGNGHFLTSGGAMTGMVGHSGAVLDYWRNRETGERPEKAIVRLADQIKEGTEGWLHVSATEYTDALPINFGAERIAQINAAGGAATTGKSHVIESSRRLRHSLLVLNPSDWRRPLLRSGRVYSGNLPELHAVHPALRKRQRPRKAAKVSVGFVVQSFTPQTLRLVEAVLGQPGVQLGLVTEDSLDRLTDRIRDRVVAAARVESVTDGYAVAGAFRRMEATLGTPTLLLGTEHAVQVALANVRKALGIAGADAGAATAIRDTVRLRTALQDAGIPVLPFGLVRSVEEGLDYAEERGFYPFVLREAGDRPAVHRIESQEELYNALLGLEPSATNPLIIEDAVVGQQNSLEIIVIGGVPAWASATRRSHGGFTVQSTPGLAWSVTLPRDGNDPADPIVRQMGFAALRAMGVTDGMVTVDWVRRPDGSAIITDIHTTPPPAHVFSLMALSHGADLYRAWANAVVNGVFGPIPRLFAAGVVFLRGKGKGETVAGVDGWDAVRAELGDLVVEAKLPEPGAARSESPEGDGYVLVRHAETARVDAALQRIALAVKVRLGK